MSKKVPTQQERIRAYLDSGKVLTRLNAWSELGILEAPARISELRRSYPISTTMVTVINRYGEPVRVAEWRKAEPGSGYKIWKDDSLPEKGRKIIVRDNLLKKYEHVFRCNCVNPDCVAIRDSFLGELILKPVWWRYAD